MDFADDGVACDTHAELACNLTGAQTVRPQFFQRLNAIFCPWHFFVANCRYIIHG
jgi:hypothetical protein